VEHIKSVTISKGKGIARSTFTGAVSGGVLLGSAAFAVEYNEYEEEPNNYTNAIKGFGIGFGAGVVIGAPIGFFTGLFRRNKIHINGNSANMSQLQTYF
jgi:hypothetical protein